MVDPALPPATLNTDGEWDDVIGRLYGVFCQVFDADPPLTIRGKTVTYDRRLIEDNRPEGFWHVTTRGKKDRLFDPGRARKLSWIEPIILGTIDKISRWEYKEGDGSTRLYFWLEEYDYVIIFAERQHVAVLITAYHIDRDWMFRDLEKKRAKGVAF